MNYRTSQHHSAPFIVESSPATTSSSCTSVATIIQVVALRPMILPISQPHNPKKKTVSLPVMYHSLFLHTQRLPSSLTHKGSSSLPKVPIPSTLAAQAAPQSQQPSPKPSRVYFVPFTPAHLLIMRKRTPKLVRRCQAAPSQRRHPAGAPHSRECDRSSSHTAVMYNTELLCHFVDKHT